MKSLLKNLGLLLIIITAVCLIAIFLTGSTAINDNSVLGGTMLVMVIGLILHIILNKKITD